VTKRRRRERERGGGWSEGDQERIVILALSQRLRGNIFSSYDEKLQEERREGGRERNKGGAG